MNNKPRAVQPNGYRLVLPNGSINNVEFIVPFQTFYGTAWEVFLFEDDTKYTTEDADTYLLSDSMAVDDRGCPIYDGDLCLINDPANDMQGLYMIVRQPAMRNGAIFGGFKCIKVRPFIGDENKPFAEGADEVFINVVSNVFVATEDNVKALWLEARNIPMDYRTLHERYSAEEEANEDQQT